MICLWDKCATISHTHTYCSTHQVLTSDSVKSMCGITSPLQQNRMYGITTTTQVSMGSLQQNRYVWDHYNKTGKYRLYGITTTKQVSIGCMGSRTTKQVCMGSLQQNRMYGFTTTKQDVWVHYNKTGCMGSLQQNRMYGFTTTKQVSIGCMGSLQQNRYV